jgi:hypothetical protein
MSSTNVSSNITAMTSDAASCLFLCLVSDEVDLRFAGDSWNWSRNVDLWSFICFLDQNVDQCFLFILCKLWNCLGIPVWGFGCLDENDLVMFLCRRKWRNISNGSLVMRFWGRYVDVDMLLD